MRRAKESKGRDDGIPLDSLVSTSSTNLFCGTRRGQRKLRGEHINNIIILEHAHSLTKVETSRRKKRRGSD